MIFPKECIEDNPNYMELKHEELNARCFRDADIGATTLNKGRERAQSSGS